MSKTGIRPYETKTHGTRWMAYYRKDGRQFFKRGFRTAGKLLARAWAAGAGPGDAPFTIDLDSTICEQSGGGPSN